jgi:pyruvate kinase
MNAQMLHIEPFQAACCAGLSWKPLPHSDVVSQVRLNMTHSDHAWHADVINKINELNKSGFNIAVMVDTEGSEAHLKAQDPVRVEVSTCNCIRCNPYM